MKSLILFSLLLFSFNASAQRQEEKPSPTTNTSWEAEPELKKKGKNYLTIYRQNAEGLLIGNKCLEDQTRKMGFNYVLLPEEGPGSKTQTGVFLHNFGARFLLMFKNGPFWSLRLKKKVKECRRKTGDYMG